MRLKSGIDASWYLLPYGHPDEIWGGPFPAFASGFDFLTRFLSHFSAPGFFFLMGLSMVLLEHSRIKAGWSRSQIVRFFCVRGFTFILLQFTLENFLWGLSSKVRIIEMFGYVGVLFGLGMSCLLAMLFLRVSRKTVFAISVLGFLLFQIFYFPEGDFTKTFTVGERIIGIPGQTGIFWVNYPILPWLLMTLFGLGFGKLYLANPQKNEKLWTTMGLIFLGAFAVIRFATPFGNLRALPENANWMQYLTLVKYPPSLLFVLATMGVNFLILGLWQKIPMGELRKIFVILGQAPFFFYFAHLALYALMGFFLGSNLTLLQLYLAWGVGVVLLIPLTSAYGKFKQKTAMTSLWRLF